MLLPNDQIIDLDAIGCLRGARCWLITSGKAGMVTQAKGIADALAVEPILKTVSPKGIWRLMAPWGGVSPAERFGSPGTTFAPPWPEIAIAVGRDSIPYIRRLRREAGRACYTIVLQDPRSGPNTADLIWVPAHDKRRGPNVITSVISPHGFTLDRLDGLRDQSHLGIEALASPRVAVILGGRNAVYNFTAADDQRLANSLRQIAGLGASFLITASRRTHPSLLDAVEQATSNALRIFWRNEDDGPNPYGAYLARADWFVVTADSVNMTGEVCATGRPLYVFHPSGGSAKFSRYHQCLEELGAARPLPHSLAKLEHWSYEPQISATMIANEIERRYIRRQRMLAGT
jgi:mitochondrial fission protein ELM1